MGKFKELFESKNHDLAKLLIKLRDSKKIDEKILLKNKIRQFMKSNKLNDDIIDQLLLIIEDNRFELIEVVLNMILKK